MERGNIGRPDRLMAAGLLAMGHELDSFMTGMMASMGIIMAGLAVQMTVGEIATRLPGRSSRK